MWKRFRVAIQTSDGKAFEAFCRERNVQGAIEHFKSFLGTNVTAVSASVVHAEAEPVNQNPFRELPTGATITDPMAVLNGAPEANGAAGKPKARGGRPAGSKNKPKPTVQA